MGQSQRMMQSLVIAPQLQQAIKMLTLTHMEMTDMIAQELVENPLLEEGQVGDEEGTVAEREAAEGDNTGVIDIDQLNQTAEIQNTATTDDFDWEKYLEPYSDYSASIKSNTETLDEDLPQYENMVTKTESLAEHLEWQFRMEYLQEEEFLFGEHIIHSLDEDGFLDGSIESYLKEFTLPIERAKEIIKIIQRLDPVGCATSNTKEALMVQAEHLEETPFALVKIIENHLEDLYKRHFEIIHKKTGLSVEEIKHCELILSNLNPRPGRQISSDAPQYIVPDIYVREVGGTFTVEINNDGIPDLRISKLYKSLLKQPNQDAKSKDFVKDKLRSAIWLLKSIENRQKTIAKVATAIVKFQPDFLLKGPAYMKPMILRDVASEIGMHESTVSRVTTNKYMHTPIGVFELKYFFNTGVGGKSGGDAITGEVIRMRIKNLVEREDKKRPLSDDKIVLLLAEVGMELARRTVAKYRDELGILSSAKRKQK